MLPAVPLEVERGEVYPKLTRRVRDHGVRTVIVPRVALDAPQVHLGQSEVDTFGGNK